MHSPQVMFGVPFGQEIDMWSVGCILAEVKNFFIKTKLQETQGTPFLPTGTGRGTCIIVLPGALVDGYGTVI